MSRRSRRKSVVSQGVPSVFGLPFDDSVDVPGEVFDSSSGTLPRVLSPIQQWSSEDPFGGMGAEPPWRPRARARAYGRTRVSGAYGSPGGRRALPSKHFSWRSLNALVWPDRRAKFCVQRKQRKEVLFALRRNGRNGGRVYKRKLSSQWRCL